MTRSPTHSLTEPFYPDTDGKPMAESDPARDSLIYAVAALKLHFAERPEVYVSGNLFIYYEQGSPDAVVAPDVFVVIGAGNRQRPSYKVWEEGGLTPDFVLEITSRSTRYTDRVEKRRRYAELKVAEYVQYDPTGDYLDPPLQGLRWVEGQYEPMLASGNGSGTVALHSAVLGLELRFAAGELRFYNPETGDKLLSDDESEAARREAEARHDRVASRLLASGMAIEEVAAIAEVSVEALRQRLGDASQADDGP